MEAKRRVLLPNPGVRASLWSILTFYWSCNVITKAFKKIIYISDLWQPLPHDRSRALANKLENMWNDVNQEGRRFRLPRALLRMNPFENCNIAFLMISYTICIRVTAPLILRPTSLFFIDKEMASFEYATQCAAGFFFMVMVATLINSHVSHSCFYSGLKMQTAVWSLIYKKALRLPTTELENETVKAIKDNFSQDPSRLDVMYLYLLYIWTAPFLLLAIGGVMYKEIGMATLSGLAVIILMIPARNVLNVFCYNCIGHLGEKTRERYLKTKEVIENIEIVKKHAWIKDFIGIISKLRQKEMKSIKCNIFQHALHMVLMIFTSRLALVATIVTVVFLKGKLSPINAFIYFFYFDILTIVITQIFTRAISHSCDTHSYLKTVEKFLDMEEVNIRSRKDHKKKPEDVVMLKNLTSSWSKSDSSKGFSLNMSKLILRLQRQKLVCIVGAPKSGKTSLLHTILEDMPIISGGYINACGPIAYAPQIPWIFSSTVRQNILFGSDMCRQKYENVVRCCALLPDLCLFPGGDLTMLKEDETLLNESQKMRINLARAAYRGASVYLFDDSLAHLEPPMAQYIFENTMGPKGMLRKALRILVTNDMKYISQADQVIMIKKKGGEDVQIVKHDELNLKRYKYLIPIGEDAESYSEDVLHAIYGEQNEKENPAIRPLHKFYANEMDNEDIEDFEGDGFFDIEYSWGRYNSFLRYITEGAGSCHIATLVVAFIFLYAIIASSDLWLTFWITLEITKFNKTDIIQNLTDFSLIKTSKKFVQHTNIFYEIYDHAKGVFDDQTKYIGLPETAPCFFVYLIFIGITFSLAIIVNISFSRICLKSNNKLHNNLLNKMTSARVSFFQRTRTTKILRLFDIDMKAVDRIVPTSLLESINLFLWITGWALTTVYTCRHISIFLAIILVIFFMAQYRLLITNKRLKQLQVGMLTKISRSFDATLNALCMIRAFKVENQMQQDFDNLLDVHSSTKSTFLSTTTAYSLILEALSMSSIGIIFYLIFNNVLDINGHLLNFTVMQLVGFTGMLGWSLKQTASSSRDLSSVERIFKYCNVHQEQDPPNPEKVRKTWPEYGRVVFKDMSLGYYEDTDTIRNVSFNFRAREKVAIVGETASGKTSFVNAIYRMGLLKGTVEIDRTDISEISMEDIRSHITTITNKPAIFSGTIKSNLDPHNEYRYDDIIYALKAVDLDNLDLNMLVDHNGANLSLQQRQLLSFARAVLRNHRIIIVDEAMTNMDEETAKIVQNVITDYLGESTIFHITNQLEHIMYYDCVFVIVDGAVKENGLPYNLLQENGPFKRMVDSYEKVTPDELIEIANLKVENHPYLRIE